MYLFLGILLLVLGALIIIITFGAVIYIIRSFFRLLNVRKHGIHILATVKEIKAEYVLSMRGYTTSFFVHADWCDPETDTLYHFKSDAGGSYIPLNHPPGSSIDVLIDPHDPRRYEVQLRFEERSFV